MRMMASCDALGKAITTWAMSLLADDPLQLIRRAEPSEATEVAVALGRQETSHRVAEVRPIGQRLHDHPSDGAIADHQGRSDADAVSMERAEAPQVRRAAEHDQQRHQPPGEDQRQPRLGLVANERRGREQDHQRHARDGEDGGQVVQGTR